MLVYKEKQFLIFDFQDGKTVKYDFATKTCIGKKGKIVKNLCSQLSGISMNELIEACEDKQYAKFLEFVQRKWDYPIYNIGTILSKIPYYQRYEQIFSAGFEDICGSFSGTIKEIPKGLIKICKDHKITLSDELVLFYKENPNAYNLPYQMEFISLDDKDIHRILTKLKSIKEYYGENRWQYNWKEIGILNTLLNEYGYTAKGLFNYLDYLKTFEAIEDTGFAVEEVYDYANMMRQISNKFDKLQIDNNSEMFSYGMRTDIGNAFVHGDLKAVDTVTYPEIGGAYMYVEKIKEKYTMHTRTVTYTTGSGKTRQTHTRTETYWTWDRVGSEDIKCKEISFCGVVFDSNKIELPDDDYIDTIKTSSHIRYKYYGIGTEYTGTIYTVLTDNTISNNTPFYNGLNIDETIDHLESSVELVIFWVVWIIVIIAVVIGFYYLDNKWLEDKK